MTCFGDSKSLLATVRALAGARFELKEAQPHNGNILRRKRKENFSNGEIFGQRELLVCHFRTL